MNGSAVNICTLVVLLLGRHTDIFPLEFITSKCVMCTCNLCGCCTGSNMLFEKKCGTTLDIRDVAASYSSIVRYSCSTLLLGRQLL